MMQCCRFNSPKVNVIFFRGLVLLFLLEEMSLRTKCNTPTQLLRFQKDRTAVEHGDDSQTPHYGNGIH